VDRRSRARKIEDLIHFDVEREADVVPDHLEMRMLEEMPDVVTASRKVIIDAYDLVPA